MFRFTIIISFLQISFSTYSQQSVMLNSFKETVYPIESDTSEFNSFSPLTNFFKSKEIVGMGEATHGTHEFFKTKVEMFKFLVKKCGYKVFGIEASYGAQLYVNDYVKYGLGNIKEVMEFLDWPWGTEEVRDLVDWIKLYNINKKDKDKITFYGFDMQNVSFGIKFLNRLLLKDSSDYADTFRKITPLLSNTTENNIFQLIFKEKMIIKDSLLTINKNLKQWISLNETKISEKYGKKEFEKIYLCIENFNQSLLNIYGGNRNISFRDSCMANNVLKIQEIENNKMFIWAHNGHIGLEYQKIPIMGTYIKHILKEKYYAIGFSFDHGSFMAYKGPNTIITAFYKFIFNRKKIYSGLTECTAETNKKNTLTNELNKLNLQSFFINLDSTSNTLFITAQFYYDIGATYLNYKHASSKIIAKDQFDGLIFFNLTSATKILKN